MSSARLSVQLRGIYFMRDSDQIKEDIEKILLDYLKTTDDSDIEVTVEEFTYSQDHVILPTPTPEEISVLSGIVKEYKLLE